jgi:glycosyltransferase involved in cell wall biosynthesis
VPNGDVEALARALVEVIRSPDLRERLGAAALETASNYEIGPIGERWDAFLDSLVPPS